MVQLDLPCWIFNENESEGFQYLLKKIDSLSNSNPDKVLLLNLMLMKTMSSKFIWSWLKSLVKKWFLLISSMQYVWQTLSEISMKNQIWSQKCWSWEKKQNTWEVHSWSLWQSQLDHGNHEYPLCEWWQVWWKIVLV